MSRSLDRRNFLHTLWGGAAGLSVGRRSLGQAAPDPIVATKLTDLFEKLADGLHVLRNGRDANGEGYKLKTYPVEIRPDGIYIGLDEGGLFKWF